MTAPARGPKPAAPPPHDPRIVRGRLACGRCGWVADPANVLEAGVMRAAHVLLSAYVDALRRSVFRPIG